MIRSTVALCAEGVVRDAETNTISIFTILEQLNSPGFPLFIQKLVAFNILEIDAGDVTIYECHLTLSHNETEIMSTPIRIDFQDKRRNRSIALIGGLTISGPGIISVKLIYNNQPLSCYNIDVKSTRPPQAQIA